MSRVLASLLGVCLWFGVGVVARATEVAGEPPPDSVQPNLDLLEPTPDRVDPQELNWATNYEIPAHKCRKPRGRNVNQETTRILKFQRQSKRYVRCIGEYQQRLFADFKRLEQTSKTRVTRDEAEVLLERMTVLATTIKSFAGTIAMAGADAEMERLATLGTRAGI